MLCRDVVSVQAADRPKAYFSEELNLFGAYRQALAVSNSLHTSGHDREAYYWILIAVECYFKNVFCLVRYNYLGNVDSIRPTDLRKGNLGRVFSHDVAQLLDTLISIFPELAGEADFLSLRANMPNNNWIELRYSDPSTESTNYPVAYGSIKAHFTKIISNKFSTVVS